MKYRFDGGEINFGVKDRGPVNGPVITYKLSPEEHAKYWDKDLIKLEQARTLARETYLSPKEIADQTGADYKKVQRIHFNENSKKRKRNSQKRIKGGWM